MSQVRIEIVPDPAHVRVVRLVAVSLARVHGVDEDVVEDVRLAVGEACGRAVAAHARAGLEGTVRLAFSGSSGLSVEVRDDVRLPDADGVAALALSSGAGEVGEEPSTGEAGDLDAVATPEVMALLEGLADQVAVHTGVDGTTVRLRWATRT